MSKKSRENRDLPEQIIENANLSEGSAVEFPGSIEDGKEDSNFGIDR
ncbi:MAG: hypothetical protein R3B41_01615 [Candidatus Doudnabacteria bacterium]